MTVNSTSMAPLQLYVHARGPPPCLPSYQPLPLGPCARMTRAQQWCGSAVRRVGCRASRLLLCRTAAGSAPLSRVSLHGWPCALCLSSWKGPELPSRPKGRDTAGRLPWPALPQDGRVSRAGGFEPDLCKVGTSAMCTVRYGRPGLIHTSSKFIE